MPLNLKSKNKKLPPEILTRTVDKGGKIKCENPENTYTFDENEIGRGKFAVVKRVTHKTENEVYAAKIIKFDAETLKYALREYDLMAGFHDAKDHFRQLAGHPGLIELHEAYVVRKYLILIMEYVEGKSLLEFEGEKEKITEDDVANYVRQLLEALKKVHSMNFAHLDLRPTNLRFANARQLKILDYNTARYIPNTKSGTIVDVIADTEFCAPEMLNFGGVGPFSDIWALGVHVYIMLSGVSPFYNENEDLVIKNVQEANWSFCDEFEASSEAKAFIKDCLKKQTEKRPTCDGALNHKWLSEDYASTRKAKTLNGIKKDLLATDARLKEEEEEDYVFASLIFRTFDEEEHESSSEEEESDEE